MVGDNRTNSRSWLASLCGRPWAFAQLAFAMSWAFAEAVATFLWRRPRHGHDELSGLADRMLPWRVRVAIVVGTWLLARSWVSTSTAGQIGWTLEYAGSVTISLVASLWLYIFAVDLVFSLLWLALAYGKPPDRVREPYRYGISHGVEFANRQLAHIEAFLIWMGVLLPWTPRLDVQLVLLLGLALLGAGVVNKLTEWWNPWVTHDRAELQSVRRPLIYFAMLAGLLILLHRARDQWQSLLPLLLGFLLVSTIRLRRHELRETQARAHRTLVTEFRRHQRRWSRGLDVVFGPVLMLAIVLGVLALSLWTRQSYDRLAREALDGPPPDPRTCVAESGGPVADDNHPLRSMFLVADSQIHELAGERFPGQTELADLLVPAAVRPVELDMLSTASVFELKHAFGEVIDAAPRQPVYWAHLGDLADLSCEEELKRAVDMFTAFGGPRNAASGHQAVLAGIAPGNHDMSFTGNFFWSPYWTGACKTSRANKQKSNELIAQLLGPDAGALSSVATLSQPKRFLLWQWLRGNGGLMTVTPLGTIHQGPRDAQRIRSVVAIFVDTGDDATLDWGIAGLFGTYSANQDERLRAMISELRFRPDLHDPVWLVFAHHPIGELTGRSRTRLEDMLAWLDGDPFEPERSDAPGRDPDPRLLGIITAHTHHAETHRLCIAKRAVREIVIGSTIDSPQQGARLEIGSDPKGRPAIRLKTVQTVARPGFTCASGPPVVAADECQRIVARLRTDPDCEPLFDEGQKTARDCTELEQPTGLGDAIGDLIHSTSPVEPDEIKQAQTQRARGLMTCVCRHVQGSEPCAPRVGLDPLNDRVFGSRLDHRLATGGDDARKELACLSWAASAQQQHKARGMTFASALRCAFDDPTIPAEQETVATLDVEPCQ